MFLNNDQIRELDKAMRCYSYPKLLYDFKVNKEVSYPSMRELEATVRGDLRSGDPVVVKNGLSNILYWGHRSRPYYWKRVTNFRNGVTEGRLREASQVLIQLAGIGLQALKNLNMPEFSNLSFLSKVRMFLDPTNWVVLDRSLMKLAGSKVEPFHRIKEYQTYIPCTLENEQRYGDWCIICRRAAFAYYSSQGYLAVDVERGVFQLVQNRELQLAAAIVNTLWQDFGQAPSSGSTNSFG